MNDRYQPEQVEASEGEIAPSCIAASVAIPWFHTAFRTCQPISGSGTPTSGTRSRRRTARTATQERRAERRQERRRDRPIRRTSASDRRSSSPSAHRGPRAFVITMPSSIQRGTGTFKIMSVVRAAVLRFSGGTCQNRGGRCGRGSRPKGRASHRQRWPPSAAPGHSASLLCALLPPDQCAEHRCPTSLGRTRKVRVGSPAAP
jgi:hypothetical protein